MGQDYNTIRDTDVRVESKVAVGREEERAKGKGWVNFVAVMR
jgi:hypothetical protein